MACSCWDKSQVSGWKEKTLLDGNISLTYTFSKSSISQKKKFMCFFIMLVLKVSLFCGRERTKDKDATRVHHVFPEAPVQGEGGVPQRAVPGVTKWTEQRSWKHMKKQSIYWTLWQGQRVKTRKKKVSERENDITETMIRLSVGILEWKQFW